MYLLHISMQRQAAVLLSSRIALQARSCHKCLKKGSFVAYCEVGNYLLESNATYDVTAEQMRALDHEVKSAHEQYSNRVQRDILGRSSDLQSSVRPVWT